MNILQILPELKVGGVETGIIDLAKRLVEQGHKVVVVSAGGELVKAIQACGAIHYQLPVHRKSIVTVIRMVPALVELLKKEKIEIVHARSRVPAWIAYFACRKARVPFVTTCHGYYARHYFSRVMGWGKRVIVVSNVVGRHMIENFGVSYERIRRIPRSVDLEKFKYVSPEAKRGEYFNVGMVARITPLKGHLDFIKAMAKVAKGAANMKLKVWIVGDAPDSRAVYKEQLRILVKRLGLWQNTQFLGTQHDIPAIMEHLDLLVMASTEHEAFGRVVLEAQASGVPVVATRVGGVVEVIEDERTGLLVSPSDPANMAEAVIRVFKDKDLAKYLAENAYQKVREQYDAKKMVQPTLDVYQEAVSQFKILVIKLSSLGDVILSTAAIREIKNKFGKNFNLTVLVGEGAKEPLLRCPYIDELLVCDFKNKDKGLRGLLKLSRNLREKNFDLAIDLQNNRKSHLLSYLSFAPDRYGYDNKKFSFLLNHRIKDDVPALDPVTHQFRILNMLGIVSQNQNLELWPTAGDQRYVDEFLKSQWLGTNQRLVGINMSASQRWVTKNWPLGHIAKLCEELGRRDMRVVITGTDKDLDSVQALAGMVRNTKVIDACGKTTVNQLASLVKRCAVYISPDSASLHIAAAVAVPFVALFGPTDARRHLPKALEGIVINKDLPCRACYKPQCKSPKCMTAISPEEVLAAVEKIIK
jgi:lipopolysaccharide heptosyltransferase II